VPTFGARRDLIELMERDGKAARVATEGAGPCQGSGTEGFH
jgi:hypothetical protein